MKTQQSPTQCVTENRTSRTDNSGVRRMTTLERGFSISALLFPSCCASPFDGRPEKQGILNMCLDHEHTLAETMPFSELTVIFRGESLELSCDGRNAATKRSKSLQRHQSRDHVQKDKIFRKNKAVFRGNISAFARHVFLRCLPGPKRGVYPIASWTLRSAADASRLDRVRLSGGSRRRERRRLPDA